MTLARLQPVARHARVCGLNGVPPARRGARRRSRRTSMSDALNPACTMPPIKRTGHVAAADECDLHRRGARAPKIAVPTRTMVEPSAIAASRSSDIPIDSTSTFKPSSRSCRNNALVLRKGDPLLRDVGLRRGDRHQPAQAQARQPLNGGGELAELIGRDAGLARLGADVDLQQHIEPRQIRRPLFGQTFGSLQAVDRLDPVETLGDRACLVALYRPDKVPLEREVGPQRRECRPSWPPPPARSFRRTRAARLAAASAIASARNALLTASSRTDEGSRPAARAALVMRSCNASQIGLQVRRQSRQTQHCQYEQTSLEACVFKLFLAFLREHRNHCARYASAQSAKRDSARLKAL